MKKLGITFALICAAFITLFIINPPEITFEETEATAPRKPKSVPNSAFWAGGIDGGNFILVSKREGEHNLFSAQIYNDNTGDIEYSGVLKYSGNQTIERSLNDPSLYQGWDGEKLHLANGEYMAIYENNDLTKSPSGL